MLAGRRLKHWYSISELLQLRSSPCTPPGHIISSTIKELGLLRRPRYVHRGSRRTFVYSGSENSISSLWANRHPPKTRRHQHYNHTVRTVYLTPLPRAPQPITNKKPSNLKCALLNTCSLYKNFSSVNLFLIQHWIFSVSTKPAKKHGLFFTLSSHAPWILLH